MSLVCGIENTKVNGEVQWKQSGRYREGAGGLGETGEGLEKHRRAGTQQSQVGKSSPGNTVGNIVVTMDTVTWGLEVVVRWLRKVGKCVTALLHTRN